MYTSILISISTFYIFIIQSHIIMDIRTHLKRPINTAYVSFPIFTHECGYEDTPIKKNIYVCILILFNLIYSII
jgi:hypothetical protein